MKMYARSLAAFLLLIACALGNAQFVADWSDLFARLQTPETSEMASKLLVVESRKSKEAMAQVSSQLPALLLNARNTEVIRYEAMLVRELKVSSAIPALVELLDRPNQIFESMTAFRSAQMHNDPVARALYDMQAPPRALLPALGSDHKDTRARAMKILTLTASPESRAVLKEHLPSETDPELRRFLELNGITAD